MKLAELSFPWTPPTYFPLVENKQRKSERFDKLVNYDLPAEMRTDVNRRTALDKRNERAPPHPALTEIRLPPPSLGRHRSRRRQVVRHLGHFRW